MILRTEQNQRNRFRRGLLGNRNYVDVRLRFWGTQPRLLMWGRRDEAFFAGPGRELWVSQAGTSGSWSAPVNIPSDGNQNQGFPATFSNNSQGHTAIVAVTTTGTIEGVKCGLPKLSRSQDFVSWTTCSPVSDRSVDFDAQYSAITHAANDKLYLVFQSIADRENTVPKGIVLWREP